MAEGKKSDRTAPRKARAALGRKILGAIAILVIALAVMGAVFYGLTSSQSGSYGNFQSFKKAFNSAPSIFIYAEYSNASTFAYTETCAVNLIEQIIGSQIAHRNASTMSFAQLNASGGKCVLTALGPGSNSTNMSLSQCISMGAGKPGIFINYSTSNYTRVAGGDLYVGGNAQFLSQCGISAQISS
jgi:hypothetical protein